MKRMIRLGNCNHCGSCCSEAGCKQYDEAAVAGHCKTYDTRSEGCRRFPIHFIYLPTDECGYRFYDENTGERLFKKPKRDSKTRGFPRKEFYYYGYLPVDEETEKF